MKMVQLFYVLFFSIWTLWGCSENKIEEQTYLKINTHNVNFSKEARNKSITVDSNVDWSIAVEGESQSWLSAKSVENTLQIIVAENVQTAKRTGVITVHAKQEKQTITVEQLGIEKSILLSSEVFTLETNGGNIALEVTANVSYEINIPEKITWITKSGELQDTEDEMKKNFVYTVAWNSGDERKAELMVKQADGEISQNIVIMQKGKDGYNGSSQGDILDDIKVPISSGTASSYQGGKGIEKSFDGDIGTIYHSNWNNGGADYFPITLDYFFAEQESIDYFIYYPRVSGYNGRLEEVEIWVATEAQPMLKKMMDYNFKGTASATKIAFESTLEKPTTIRFIVKSGFGDRQGFASCAEMEFYRTNPDNTDPLGIFTDFTCSELKPEITEEEVAKISNNLYRKMAHYMLKGEYPREFRIQEYRAWPSPDSWAEENKTSTYSLLDNPTGIRVNEGEEFIVFVGNTQGNKLSVKIQNLDKPGGDGYGNASMYGLSEGVNKIIAKNKGLVYVLYHTADYETAPKVKIHFATGEVSGYFDNQKHQASDWYRLLNAATDDYFDVVGKYAHLTFPTSAFKSYALNNGTELIAAYDEMVRIEQDFMGLVKYNRPTVNRAYFHVMYHAYMYSTSYRTAYNENTLSSILDVNTFKSNPWGPAHELGHTNQTYPGFKWVGMTEVSNNVHSLYVQTEWGNPSRIENENLGDFNNRYEKAFYQFFVQNTVHGEGKDVFCRLVPFWQLQLYFAKVKGQTDFYKDFYEQIRTQPNPSTNGAAQLNFIRLSCELTGVDLTSFFKNWGMLSPIDIEVDDYGKGRLKITQNEIDNLISEIKSKGYATLDDEMQYICDSNWQHFQNRANIVEGSGTHFGNRFTMRGWQNVVAYEVWNGGTLIYVSNRRSFTIKTAVTKDIKVYAIAYNGEKKEVVF